MKEIKINTDFIKLDQFLKLVDIAQSGGHGKMIILDGLVKVNGQIVVQRGKKLYKDDIIELEDYDKFVIV